jgi:hypothetical protein
MSSFDGDQDKEEESSWIPMLPDDRHQQQHQHQHHLHGDPAVPSLNGESQQRVAYSILEERKGMNRNIDPLYSNKKKSFRSNTESSTTFHNESEDVDNSNSNLGNSNPQLRNIQNKLEDRISIQTHLVDRPLEYFWQFFLINLVRQVWALEIRIQLGILMLATGLSARIFLWSTWYILYPRFAILSLILLASLLYLDPFDVHHQLRGTWSMIATLFGPSSSQQKQVVVESIDTHKLRSLSFILFMIPSILEIRTFSFLSRINAERALNGNGWTTASLYCYNVGVAVCILSMMAFLRRVRGMRSCDVSYRGLLILYGFSLLITIVSFESNKNDVRQILVLAAPFLTATATLLLMCEDDSYEWLSRITRQAFRLSLRDVFSSVSERVTEDDMLQLAILRWICDFWASNPASTTPETKGESKNSNSVPTPPSAAQTNRSSGKPSEAQLFKHNSIQWEELQPMLNIEIDHMETEIDALRIETTHSSHGDNSSHAKQEQDRWKASDQPAAMTSVKQSNNDHTLMDLKSMLLSFNVNDRAQPAVLAFRRAVESFPPKKKTAVAISILRRCPAFVTMILHTFFLGDLNSLFRTSLILFPFLVMEYYRIVEWMEACQQVVSVSSDVIKEEQKQNDWRVPTSLKNVDTMTILLSGDRYTAFRPPSLLIVWFNIVSSVSALEMGLSTARCVETTAVAIEFAGSAMSLVQFGCEISQNGLLHGVMVLAKEVLSIHRNGRDIANLDFSDDDSAQYTSAAVRAVRYGQKIVRNINVISEDENIVSIAQPFLKFFEMLTGGGKNKKEDEDDGVSTSPDKSDEALLDNAELQDKKKEIVENATDRRSIVDETSEVEKLWTTPTLSEGETTSGKHQVSSSVLPAKCDLIRMSPTPEEDLSEVVEMIATSYEHGLIDQNEKDDLFKKLSELQREELYDPSVLFAMKRTLTIILENGSMVTTIDNAESSSVIHKQNHSSENPILRKCENDSSLDLSLTDDVSTSRPDSDRSDLSEIEGKGAVNQRGKESQASQSKKQNDDILTLGIAALGIVASGIAVTMISDAKKSDSKQYSIVTEDNTNASKTNKEEIKREALSDVEIVEMTDHNTDDWVALVH